MTFLDQFNRLPPDAQQEVLTILGRALKFRGANAQTLRSVTLGKFMDEIAAVFVQHGMELEQYT